MKCRHRNWTVTLIALIGFVVAGPATAQDQTISVSDITPQQEQELLEHLQQHHEDATKFVIGQFENHDLVLLGETHRIAENCQFVSSLIAPMYEAGARILFTEFTRSENNPRLKQLVTAAEFDETLAIQLFREGAWPTWGFQEYLEILKTAWQLNQSLPADAPKFEVIGIDSAWSQYDNFFGDQSRVQHFQQTVAREKNMETIIRAASLDRQKKALVHIGSSHTNTKQGIRLGKVLTDDYGSRVKQVMLHCKWPGRNQNAPITDLLERLAIRAGISRPIGFEIVGTPLDRLCDTSVVYWRAIPNASLGDFAQSYVVLKPISQLHDVTWIPGFITAEKYERAKAVAVKMRYIQADEVQNVEELNQAMQSFFAGEIRK